MARNKPYRRSRNEQNESRASEKRFRRSPGNRTLTVKPQYPLDKIYITIFTEQRVCAPDGSASYEPIPHRLAATHVDMFDALRVRLSEGNSSLKSFGDRYGLSPSDVNGLVLALTGMEASTFRIAWLMKRADELLRYTNLSISEVARQSGVGSTTNLFYACQRDHHCAPTQRRADLREANDLGRFR